MNRGSAEKTSYMPTAFFLTKATNAEFLLKSSAATRKTQMESSVLVINIDRLARLPRGDYSGVDLRCIVLGQIKRYWCSLCKRGHDGQKQLPRGDSSRGPGNELSQSAVGLSNSSLPADDSGAIRPLSEQRSAHGRLAECISQKSSRSSRLTYARKFRTPIETPIQCLLELRSYFPKPLQRCSVSYRNWHLLDQVPLSTPRKTSPSVHDNSQLATCY
jgi:hypothetical protein